MSDDVFPCPFCLTVPIPDNGWIRHICPGQEKAVFIEMPLKFWQIRPIESMLQNDLHQQMIENDKMIKDLAKQSTANNEFISKIQRLREVINESRKKDS